MAHDIQDGPEDRSRRFHAMEREPGAPRGMDNRLKYAPRRSWQTTVIGVVILICTAAVAIFATPETLGQWMGLAMPALAALGLFVAADARKVGLVLLCGFLACNSGCGVTLWGLSSNKATAEGAEAKNIGHSTTFYQVPGADPNDPARFTISAANTSMSSTTRWFDSEGGISNSAMPSGAFWVDLPGMGEDEPSRRLYFESPKDMGITIASVTLDPKTGIWTLNGLDIKINVSDPLTAYAISFEDAVELGKDLSDDARLAFAEQQLTYRTMGEQALKGLVEYWKLQVPATSVLSPLVNGDPEPEPEPTPPE